MSIMRSENHNVESSYDQKKDLENKLVKGMKTNNRVFFQTIRSRMSARVSAELIDDGGVIGECKEDKTMLEKLSVFFTLMLTSEEFRKVLTMSVFLAKNVLKELF